jgi:hypothetical protein
MIRFKRGIQARLSGHPLRGLALSLFLPSSDHVLLKAVPSRPFNKEELQAFRDHEVLSVTDDSYRLGGQTKGILKTRLIYT